MSIGIISTENQLLTNTTLQVNWLKSNSIEEINLFCHEHDIIIFDGMNHITWHQSNLPKPHKKNNTLTPNKFIAKFNGKEIYMPLNRIDWSKFDLILFGNDNQRKQFMIRAIEQNFSINTQIIKLCKYPYIKISPGKKCGVYELHETSNLQWTLKEISKFQYTPNEQVYIFGDDMKYKPCENYFKSHCDIDLVYNHKTNIIDWLSYMAYIIFPNYGIGDLLIADLCESQGIKVICQDELREALDNHDDTKYQTFDEIVSNLLPQCP